MRPGRESGLTPHFIQGIDLSSLSADEDATYFVKALVLGDGEV